MEEVCELQRILCWTKSSFDHIPWKYLGHLANFSADLSIHILVKNVRFYSLFSGIVITCLKFFIYFIIQIIDFILKSVNIVAVNSYGCCSILDMLFYINSCYW